MYAKGTTLKKDAFPIYYANGRAIISMYYASNAFLKNLRLVVYLNHYGYKCINHVEPSILMGLKVLEHHHDLFDFTFVLLINQI